MNTPSTLEDTVNDIVDKSEPISVHFDDGAVLVRNGEFVTQGEDCRYASVPLTLIRNGAITILENGKAIKHLRSGECFGLFETAYALRFGKSARIGRWSLRADGPTDVVTLSRSQVEPLAQEILARAVASHVPKPLSRLPVLDEFAHILGHQPVDDVVLIYHSHLLESSYDLLKHAGSVFGYHNVFVLEKPYSTIDSVFRKISQTGIRAYTIKVEENVPYEFSVKRSVDFVWDAAAQHARRHAARSIVVLSDGGDFLLQTPWDKLGA